MRENKHIVFVALGFVILFVAALMRFPGLDANPPGFWQDEASTGLDAWLLWHTGRDQAGQFLPILARSFGDFPLAGYRYLSAPIVGIFGPTIGNERFMAALFGTLTIAAVGIFVAVRYDRPAALGAMLSATLCPTWLHFSRYGSEAILLPATLTIGCALIAVGEKTKRHKLLWAGAASLALSAYTYHAVKLFLPLWTIGFLWFVAPTIVRLWKDGQKKHVLGPALVFTVLVLPSVYYALTDGGLARGRTVLAWYHHPTEVVWRVILNNYLSYFDPSMLFIRGGPAAAQQIPGLGMWNIADLVPMIVGFVAMMRSTAHRRFAIFVAYWFLLGPLPGGVTYESHNMGRAIGWLPAPQIISGIGIGVIASWSLTRLRADTLAARVRGAVLLALLTVGWAATAYAVYWCTFVRYPRIAQRDFQFDVSQGLLCARRVRKDEKLIVSPGFQVGGVFARFLYGDLDGPPGPNQTPIWEPGERKVVRPGELYVFPAHRPKPERGQEVCKVVHTPTGTGAAFVYGPPDPAEPEAPPPPLPNAPHTGNLEQ